ncbi:MAG: FecR domain-containing protein [Niastella sp.]|uniref:FecR domain-containing protein n=1 Tax=Niastella sp. TaxID=1869183 RepID=UPI00389A73E2
MDRNNSPINKTGDKRYPEPDVPVQAAWENMQQLLLQAPAVPARTSGFKKWLGKRIGKIMIGAGLVATVSVITLVVIKKKEQKTVTPVTYNSDSLATNHPVVAEDTLSPVVKEKRVSFEFNDMPLKKVAVDMEKGFDIKVILKGHIGERRITTRVDSITLKQMLDLITITLDCKYKIDKSNQQVIISVNGSDK